MHMIRSQKSLVTVAAGATAIALLVIACSSSNNPPASGGIVGGEGGPGVDHQVGEPDKDAGLVSNPPDGGEGGVTCPVPAFGKPTVNATFLPGSPPPDTGGAPTPGTYDLTALELYAQTSGEDDGGIDGGVATDHARATFALTSDMIQLSRTASPPGGGTDVVTMLVGKQHVSDIFLAIEETCPGTGVSQIPFTSTPTTITLHASMSRREVYTLRP